MQTLLEQYRERQKALASPATADKPADTKGYFAYMELMYRIQVLECFRNLVNTAPISTRLPVLSSHYAAVDALVSHLLMERRYQPSRDLETQQARDTARQALISIVKDLLRDSGRALWLNCGRVGLFPGGDILLDHAPNHFLQFVASKQLAADMDLHSLTSFQLRVPLQIFADCLYDEITLLIL